MAHAVELAFDSLMEYQKNRPAKRRWYLDDKGVRHVPAATVYNTSGVAYCGAQISGAPLDTVFHVKACMNCYGYR